MTFLESRVAFYSSSYRFENSEMYFLQIVKVFFKKDLNKRPQILKSLFFCILLHLFFFCFFFSPSKFRWPVCSNGSQLSKVFPQGYLVDDSEGHWLRLSYFAMKFPDLLEGIFPESHAFKIKKKKKFSTDCPFSLYIYQISK